MYLAFDKENGKQLACKIVDLQALYDEEQRRRKQPGKHEAKDPVAQIKLEVDILSKLSHVSAHQTSILWSPRLTVGSQI